MTQIRPSKAPLIMTVSPSMVDQQKANSLSPQTQVTVITAVSPKRLTKSYGVNGKGDIVKSPGGALVSGHAEVKKVDSMQSFASLLQGLATNQAVVFGLPAHYPVRIVSKAQYFADGCPDDCLPRTNKTFEWQQGSGIFMLDHDPVDGHRPHDRASLMNALSEIFPHISSAGSVWWASSSSCLFNGGDQVSGIKGQRLYYTVKDAIDIPRAGKVLIDRFWLDGHGFYEVSRSGQALERTVFDASVWQASRLDFAAGAPLPCAD